MLRPTALPDRSGRSLRGDSMRARAEGLEVVGAYHSHPSSAAGAIADRHRRSESAAADFRLRDCVAGERRGACVSHRRRQGRRVFVVDLSPKPQSLSPISEEVSKPSAKQPDERGLRREHPVAVFQAKDDAEGAGAFVVVRLGEAPADLRDARLVRIAVVRGFRDGAVTPVPLDGGAVVILKVVISALELGSRRHADRAPCPVPGVALSDKRRALGSFFSILVVRLRSRRLTPADSSDRRSAETPWSPWRARTCNSHPTARDSRGQACIMSRMSGRSQKSKPMDVFRRRSAFARIPIL